MSTSEGSPTTPGLNRPRLAYPAVSRQSGSEHSRRIVAAAAAVSAAAALRRRSDGVSPSPSTASAATAAASSSAVACVSPSASPVSFWAQFFLPLTFYRSLECRLDTRPIFLRRTLQYGLAELQAERKCQRHAQRKLIQQMKRRGGSAAATAAAATAAASRQSNPPRPYVHPDDLLGMKQAVAAAAAASSSSSPSRAAFSTSPTKQRFLSHLASKKLQVSVEQITFHKSRTSHHANNDSIGPPPASCSTLHGIAHLVRDRTPASVLCQSIERRDGGEGPFSDTTFLFNTINFFRESPLAADRTKTKRVFRNPPRQAPNPPRATAQAASDAWSLRLQFSTNAPKAPTPQMNDSLAASTSQLYSHRGHAVAPVVVRPRRALDDLSMLSASGEGSYLVTHSLMKPAHHNGTLTLGSSASSSEDHDDECVRVNILALTTNESGNSAIATHHVVGTCLLRITWIYKQHLEESADVSIPRPRRLHARPSSNENTLVAWRYTSHPGGELGEGLDSASAESSFISTLSSSFSSAPSRDPSVQFEYRSSFGCTLCGLSSSSHLRSFPELMRHLLASHSGHLTFHFRLPTKLPSIIVAALSPSPVDEGESPSPKPTFQAPTERSVVAYEVCISPKAQTSSAQLASMILAHGSKAASFPYPPQGGETSSTAMSTDWLEALTEASSVPGGLPSAFIEGIKQQRAQAKVAPFANASAPQAPAFSDGDLPHHYFCFLGGKYGQRRADALPSLTTGPLAPGHARAARHHLFEPKDDPHSVKQLLVTAGEFARAQHRAAAEEGQQPPKQSTVEGPLTISTTSAAGAVTPSPSPSPSTPSSIGGGAKSSRTRPAQHRSRSPGSSAIPSSLSSRAWYHASSGTPLALNELAYDSDEHVDEEWYIDQKSRLIDEFEDVSASEKAFIKIWNEFLLRKQASSSREIVYADYLFPTVCATFATTCAPLLRGHLRGAFTCHLLTCWEFGLLEHGDIEAILRLLDAAADEWPIKAGARFVSLHAPASGRACQTKRDMLGGMETATARAAHNQSPHRKPAVHDGPSAPSPSPPPPTPNTRKTSSGGGSGSGGAVPVRSARLREREILKPTARTATRRQPRGDAMDTGSSQDEDGESGDEGNGAELPSDKSSSESDDCHSSAGGPSASEADEEAEEEEEPAREPEPPTPRVKVEPPTPTAPTRRRTRSSEIEIKLEVEVPAREVPDRKRKRGASHSGSDSDQEDAVEQKTGPASSGRARSSRHL